MGKDILCMPKTNWFCLDSSFNILVAMILSFSAVIHFTHFYMGKFRQNFVHDFIIFGQISMLILFLHKINPNSFIPINFASFNKLLLMLFWLLKFKELIDEPNCKVRELFSHLLKSFIQNFCPLLLIMNFHNIPFLIILCQFIEQSAKL